MPRAHAKSDRVFHALGDPTRRSIVEKLCRKPLAASQLAVPLGITLTAVVQHIRILEKSGLVRTEKSGRVRTCHIEPSGFGVIERWIGDRRSIWARRLERLGEMLAED